MSLMDRTVPGPKLLTALFLAAIVAAGGATPAGAAPASLVDDTVAEFSAAPPGAGTWVVEPGAVSLRPGTLSEGFDALVPDLPASLTAVLWNAPAGSATVGSGSVTIDGARVHPATTHSAPQALEFRATFADADFQHIGFGATFEGPPWAMFSTGGAPLARGLYARTRAGAGTVIDEPIAADPLVPHTYRIEWSPAEVRFLVDGALVATHAIPIAAEMRPVASDFVAGFGSIQIDWLGLGDLPAAGVYESRVHDAGDPRAVWGALTATSSGGTVAFETRTGNVAAPDASWSEWQPVGAGGAIASPARRYLQYRATLGGTAPSLDRVEIDYEIDADAPAVAIDGVDVSGSSATARFSSAATDVDRFECRLGDAPAAFEPCTSPRELSGLAGGTYTMYVRAIDRVGNVGTAAEREFTIADPPPAGSGTVDPQSPSPTPTPPVAEPDPVVEPDTSAPGVRVVTRSTRASASGVVALVVRCPRGEVRCRVTMRLKHGRTTSRPKTVSVLGGKRATVRLRLPKATRSRLAASGRLRVSALVTARDDAGNVAKTAHRVTLRAPVA